MPDEFFVKMVEYEHKDCEGTLKEITIIGGGLAGSEAAWQAANAGFKVKLFEMRPEKTTGAHQTGDLAELICSNSLGSNLPDRAAGLLKAELRSLGSMIMTCADETALPAGGALAVDRSQFSQRVTQKILEHPNIELVKQEVTEIPGSPTVIATGPLTSPALSDKLLQLTGTELLYFFDAIAPIVALDSINMEIAFRASRYDWENLEGGDYLNCPLSKEQYTQFIHELITAERIPLASFDLPVEKGTQAGRGRFFEGCLPVEILARRDVKALAYGPMRPVGLRDPHTGKRPYAVVQLRQDNLKNTLYNMVGFQTNLTFPEQKRVFQMIPGLENAEFIRFGQMHRNTFMYSPELLNATLQFKNRPDLFFAGQIVGIEGYIGNVASGLLAGINISRYLNNQPLLEFPQETMIGALHHYITHASPADFQPMKANYGILPPLDNPPRGKKERGMAYTNRSLTVLSNYCLQIGQACKESS